MLAGPGPPGAVARLPFPGDGVGRTLAFVSHHRRNTVAPARPAVPAHAARPDPPRARRLAAVGAVLLLFLGVVVAARAASSRPMRSNPPSAEYMKVDTPASSAPGP